MDATPANLKTIDDATKTAVTSTHYETVNARRGAQLTQDDREEIAFVQKRKIPLPASAPAKGPQRP